MEEVMGYQMKEAVDAGERALITLKAAQKELNSAKNWGFIDLFGGGLVTDFIKHSKLNHATKSMERAKYDLGVFQRELQDVHVPLNLHIEVEGFLKFADFFFDGVVADYLVQSKIQTARNQLEDAIYRVESILMDLKERR